MAYELSGKLSLQIFFLEDSGQSAEFPFSEMNRLGFLHMSCSIRLGIPMFHLHLHDGTRFLENSPFLGDATRIRFVISANGQAPTTFTFRLNKFERNTTSPGVSYTMDGYLDFPLYWLKAGVVSVKGSSSQAIREIVSSCGISDLEILSTQEPPSKGNSSNVWQSSNQRNHQWVRSIANCGYLDQSNSLMVASLDLSSKFRYLDLASIKTKVHSANLAKPEPGFILFTDVQPIGLSGSLNNFAGYSESFLVQDILQTGVHTKVSNASLKLSGEAAKRKVNQSGPLKSSLQQTPLIRVSPIDVGNTPNFAENASYRNKRLGSIHSNVLESITPIRTEIQLLDRVSLVFDETHPLRLFSGESVVSSRSIFIRDLTYIEKFELVRPTFYQ